MPNSSSISPARTAPWSTRRARNSGRSRAPAAFVAVGVQFRSTNGPDSITSLIGRNTGVRQRRWQSSGAGLVSGEQFSPGLRELPKRAALMQLQPAALRSGAAKGEWSGERVHNALHCGMLSVLDLDPSAGKPPGPTRSLDLVTLASRESVDSHGTVIEPWHVAGH
jgi:hypothetical protein